MRHIPELDGIRGIAVLLVCLYHFVDLPLGWSGVDLFFVLSGCLITGILLDSKDDEHYFANFYMRRILRIFPLYYLCCLAFFMVLLPMAHAHGKWLQASIREWPWYLIHLSNWRSARGVLALGYVGHFWSLAVEEQYYFVWPLIVRFTSRRSLKHVCLFFIGGSLVLRLLYSNSPAALASQEFVYRLTPFRLDALAFGSLIPVLLREKRKYSPIPFVLIGVVVVALCWPHGSYWITPMNTIGYTGIGLVYFGVVLHANQRSVLFLCNKVLRSFGKYSYAIYLFHIPVARTIGQLLRGRVQSMQVYNYLVLLVALPLTYLLAWISWRVIETPFLNLKDRWSYRQEIVQLQQSADEVKT